MKRFALIVQIFKINCLDFSVHFGWIFLKRAVFRVPGWGIWGGQEGFKAEGEPGQEVGPGQGEGGVQGR